MVRTGRGYSHAKIETFFCVKKVSEEGLKANVMVLVETENASIVFLPQRETAMTALEKNSKLDGVIWTMVTHLPIFL